MRCDEGKTRYSTKTDALEALVWASLIIQERTERHPIRVHPCTHCHGWHLTSQPYDPNRRRRAA